MRNIFVVLFMSLAVLIGICAGASAQERFALVIGNSEYRSVGALPNPVRDAKAVGDLLELAGFEVTSALDLGQSDMRRAVRDFAAGLKDKGDDTVALVYFAGHGVQIDGENYLLPVDADITQEADVALEGVRLADLMNLLDSAPSKTRIVILDACRNDPFDELKKTAGRGLAIVNAPAGTVVAYSTSPGAMAADGNGENSPFTAALVEAAKKPGAPIETVFQNVRLAVHKATKGKQTPWEVTALTEPFVFFPGEAGEKIEPAADKSEVQWRGELQSRSPREAYDVVIQQNTVIVYQIFLAIYPDTSWGRRIRGIMERRVEMLAWFDALTLNSAAAFEAFLARYPDSDLALTAKRLKKRARTRALAANSTPGALGIAAEPQIKTVIKEVPVEVIREVRIPSPPEIKTVIKEVPVEVIREVRVPVVKIREVIKEVPVVRIKEVIKTVKVPVIKIKEVIRTVKVPVVKIKTVVKTVKVPCRCSGGGGGGHKGPSVVPRQTFNPQLNSRSRLR